MTTMPEAKFLREREAQRKQRDGWTCEECGALLIAVAVEGEVTAVCSTGRLEHQGYKEPPRGETPWWVRQRKEDKRRRDAMTQAITPMTQEQARERVELAAVKWPRDMAPAHMAMMASLAVQYGLDPAFGEIMVYQGKPYVTLDGRLRKAHEHAQFAGYRTWPMKAEEKEAYSLDKTDIVFWAEVNRNDWKVPVTEWGRVTQKEIQGSNEHTPLRNFPTEMAQKRALHRALRRAFPLDIPGFEEAQGEMEAEFRVLDRATGELLDTTPSSEPSEPSSEATSEAKPTQEPETPESDGSAAPAGSVRAWVKEEARKLGYTPQEALAAWGVKAFDEYMGTPEEAVVELAQRKGE